MRRLIAFFVVPLLIGGGILLVHLPSVSPAVVSLNGDDPSDTPTSAGPSPTDGRSEEPTGDPDGDDPDGDDDTDRGGDGDGDDPAACAPREVLRDHLRAAGFSPGDYVLGSRVDWSRVPHVNDSDGFSDPLRSQAALQRFLSSDRPSAVAARSLIGDVAVTSDRFVTVQFHRPVHYDGNWYWHDGRAKKGGQELVMAGDIWYANVDVAACDVDLAGWVRAVCGNVGVDHLMPAVRAD